MKRKILSIIVSVSFIMCSSLIVSAEEIHVPASILNNDNVEDIYFDQNGKMFVITSDVPLNTNESVSNTSVSKFILPMLKASRANPIYTSTLGPSYDYKELRATNEVSNDAIDSMWIQCTGYYSTGSYIGNTIKKSDPDWKYMSMTAKVVVADSPFDSFKVGSGLSDHQYRDSRFEPIDHHLTWSAK